MTLKLQRVHLKSNAFPKFLIIPSLPKYLLSSLPTMRVTSSTSFPDVRKITSFYKSKIYSDFFIQDFSHFLFLMSKIKNAVFFRYTSVYSALSV